MTIKQEREKSRTELEKYGFDGSYWERDLAVERLQDEFYEMCGIDVQETEVKMLGDDWEEKLTPGWCVAVLEEDDTVVKDFKVVGHMVISCRGMMYRMECEIGEETFEATNLRGLVQEEGADRWLKSGSGLWRNS